MVPQSGQLPQAALNRPALCRILLQLIIHVHPGTSSSSIVVRAVGFFRQSQQQGCAGGLCSITMHAGCRLMSVLDEPPVPAWLLHDHEDRKEWTIAF